MQTIGSSHSGGVTPSESTLRANSATTVVVGMSGGVDSSVTAALLKEQGYRVIGMFMKNWDEKNENGVCTSVQDFQDVARVCDRLDIPYTSVEFVKEYWDNVFSHFLREYAAGHTPNPDILCNREIKFNVFFRKAIEEMGADFLATGHYCQSVLVPGAGPSDISRHRLVKGADAGKDQTYFLYTMREEVLRKVLFPVGALQKKEVREIAHKYDLATKEKKDSTGICFIGERDFREFLSKYIAGKPGDFRHLDGTVAGRHYGAAYYTLGQRRGLGLGGEGESWYVVGKDISKNIVYVERGGEHPALYADELWATELSLVDASTRALGAGFAIPAEGLRLRAKVRYRQPDQDCVAKPVLDAQGNPTGGIHVAFDQPQRSITPRQSVVFYQGDVCLGGAMIDRAGASYYEQGRTIGHSIGLTVPSAEVPELSALST